MKVAVRSYTKTGHTKKLAEAIAAAAGTEALDISHPLTEDVDVLFLGSAVYAAGLMDDSIEKFVKSIDLQVGKLVNFSSAALLGSTKKQVTKFAQTKGIPVAEEEFFCKGEFKFIAKGRPNAQDVADAKRFAEKVLAQ